MGRRLFWAVVLGGLLSLGAIPQSRESTALAVPNVVVMLTDDIGWTDWQYDAVKNPTGSKLFETPNLLAMAQQSVLFNNAYAACPTCSPSRASVLTGKSPARLKLTNFLPGSTNFSPTLAEPSNWVRNLPASEITLAESFKSAGYSTGFFGKWHLGSNVGNPGIDPLQNGFDVNIGGTGYGGPDGGGGWFAGSDGAWATVPGLDTPGTYPADKYMSDAVDEKMGDFIQQHAGGPFFVADWSFLSHIPLQAPAALVSKYQTKINTLQGQGVDLHGQTNATYAAMMEKLDQSVGYLLQKLDNPDGNPNTADSIRDNTIIVFSSDNGGVYAADGNPTSNYPSREGKGSMYEGGLRVPQMISWTGNPSIAAGTITNARTTSYDMYPTILDLAGLLGTNGVAQNTTLDGVSIKSALQGNSFDRGLLYWHYPHRSNQDTSSALINGGSFVSAVSDNTWKLIFFYEDRHYELYNLLADPSESNNLLAYNPGIARDLSLALQNYLVGVGALMPVLISTGQPVAAPNVTAIQLPGDYNTDGFVTAADYSLWRTDFGSTTILRSDGNRNGIVDAADYVFWRNIFLGGSGSGSGLGGIATIPEPSSALLVAIGLFSFALPGRRRRTGR